jgi:ubiquinol-cytochrome c reductase iron-sulfur subunit
MKRWLVAAIVLLLGKRRAHPRYERPRLVPRLPPDRGAEVAVLVLLVLATLSAAAFPVLYAISDVPRRTQFLGLSLGLALAFLSAACIVVARRLVVPEQNEEEYKPPAHVAEQEEIERLVDESGDRFTRKRLLIVGAGAAGTALTAAVLTPAVSLGPFLDVTPFTETPWRRGRRLVDEVGRVYRLDEIEPETFYTAYPEGAYREDLGAPLVLVRLPPSELHLPRGRERWAPDGIVAYSKICTHAGCAVALYRKPTFPEVQPRPALVCPCHYSTFDPADGGSVIFGPAGRPLPQLPLMIGAGGELRAGGNFSGPVGPSWWGVRMKHVRSKP